MKNKKYRIVFLLLFTVCLAFLPAADAYAASSLKLYYYATNKTVTYTNKQIKYVLDSASINTGSTPGILVNGYALASYTDVFVNSSIKLNAKYSSAKGTLTLSKDSTTIVFTIGTKKALVNGKSVTLDVAPQKVKYLSNGSVKILVPTRFVAETFNYTYVYNSSTSTVTMTSPRRLYYNNKKVAYNSTSGNVTVDGKSVNLGTMKSIIVDSTALLLAKQVFSTSSIGADYLYDSTSKTVTFTKDSTVVKLVIGSTTAYVNGKAKKMDTAPLIVKDLNTNKSYVMVPGSFVATNLGYNYTWNATSKTSVITTKSSSTGSGGSTGSGSTGTGSGGSLGSSNGNTGGSVFDSGAVPTLETILFNWNIQDSYTNSYNAANSITNTSVLPASSEGTVQSYINTITKETTDSTKETYSLYSAAPFGSGTVALNNGILTVRVNNAAAAPQSIYYGSSMVQTVSLSSDAAAVTTDVNFMLSSSNIKYEVTFSEDKRTMYVTLYPNYLSSITAGTKSGRDYILINGLTPMNVSLTDGGSSLILQIPNTVNAVGANTIDTSSSSYLKSLQISNTDNTISILIGKTAASKYEVAQNGSTYMICLYDSAPIVSDASVSIPLPDGVKYSDVENEDRYLSKKIAIILPGNYSSFYASNPVAVQDDVVSNVSVVNNSEQQTEIVITTSKLQGYTLAENSGTIDLTLGDPQDIYPNIVVLDPGHGGYQPGAVYSLNGKSYNEKDINYAILYEKAGQYFNAADSKIKAYYTRIDDSYVSLEDRAAFASKVGADLFVSLHMNALPTNTAIKGTDVYYGITNKNVASSGLDSKTLAQYMLDYLPGAIGMSTRSIHGTNLAVNKNNTVPAVLIELGFMTNKSDFTKMVNDDFQETTGKAIYDALCSLFEEYPTGR